MEGAAVAPGAAANVGWAPPTTITQPAWAPPPPLNPEPRTLNPKKPKLATLVSPEEAAKLKATHKVPEPATNST